uniref:50S ribosomal protein L35 n=1 Tax=Vertebrata lanosa TaxID=1261582 RepID=A0A0B5W3H9_9FLOR|nr:50S ribosomal protein L35 [Vertebrata lanosa]AJH65950.1 50S ribosomal protein L35 [Vertebrata lanosa]
MTFEKNFHSLLFIITYMYKLKTNRSINKRFKVTANHKLLKRRSFKSHLLQKKSSNRKRKLRKVNTVDLCDQYNFIHSLPYIKLN